MESPELKALLFSETRMAKVLSALDFDPATPSRILGDDFVVQPRTSPKLVADYYQNLHEHNDAYQDNNWLVSEYENFADAARGGIVAEIGCGNGKFAKMIAPEVKSVIAFDWAKSPSMSELPENVSFAQGDIREIEIPNVDVLCSADVLEHFTPTDLVPLISKFSAASKKQYHVIACYDDGHSHLTVMPPAAWLALFWRFSPSFAIHKVAFRRHNPKQIICVITSR